MPKQLVGLDGAHHHRHCGKTAGPQMRTAQNTLDLRSQRYDDAERETDYLEDGHRRGAGGPAIILHGHGHGASTHTSQRFLGGLRA